MPVAEECHIAVYLVRDDDDASLVTEMSQMPECVGIPAHAGRVVRIGEDEHAALLVAYFSQLVEIHGVRSTAPLPTGG